RVAIRHELAHIAQRDNLKKLALRFACFPFFAGLERAWMHAAELASDEAAATDALAAADLASALLKVAAAPAARVPELAMSLVPDPDAALRARVERLLAWQPRAANAKRT